MGIVSDAQAAPIGIPREVRLLFDRATGPGAMPLIERHLSSTSRGRVHIERMVPRTTKVRRGDGYSLQIVYEATLRTPRGDRSEKVLLGRLPAGEDGNDRSAVLVPELNLLLHVFPHDPRLEGLVDATGPGAAEILSACTGGLVSRVYACDIVKYQPERRCVLRYAIDGGAVYAKIYATDRRDVHDCQVALADESRRWSAFRIPAPLGYDDVRHMSVTADVPGVAPQAWVKKIQRSDGLPDAGREAFDRFLDAAALALAELQTSGVRTENVVTFHAEVARCRKRARTLASLGAPLVTELDDAIRILEATTVDDGRLVPAHGGFRHSQMLFEYPSVWVLDWDGFALANPCFDAAMFTGALRRAAICDAKRKDGLEDAAAKFRATFLEAQAEASRQDLEAYEALQLTRSALRWFRRPAPPGEAVTNAALLLAEAREMIS
jgi:hypothetical protein